MNAKERARVKALFDAVATRRAEVEQRFGGALSWERLDDKTASRIATYREGRITAAPTELDNIYGDLAEFTRRFLTRGSP